MLCFKLFRLMLLNNFWMYLCILGIILPAQNFSNLTRQQQQLIRHVERSILLTQQEYSQLPRQILNIKGRSGQKIQHLLNNLCSLKGASYLEVGNWNGVTLLAAAYKNEAKLRDIIGINHWLLFEGPKQALLQNIRTFLLHSSIQIIEQNWRTINKSLLFPRPITVFFYDGGINQKAAFTFFSSIFNDLFIAVVDDWNWDCVRTETRQAFYALNYRIVFEREFFTSGYDDHAWWNGLYVAVIQK